MKQMFLVVLTFLILTLGLTWIIEGNNFFVYKVFAPERANVERQVFENTAPYNQGMAQDLHRLQEEYISADEGHKPAIREIILHNFASYDKTKLPDDLQIFYQTLQNNHPSK